MGRRNRRGRISIGFKLIVNVGSGGLLRFLDDGIAH